MEVWVWDASNHRFESGTAVIGNNMREGTEMECRGICRYTQMYKYIHMLIFYIL